MGVYLGVNYKSHEFSHEAVLNIDDFLLSHKKDIDSTVKEEKITEVTILKKIKTYYEKCLSELEDDENVQFVIFLSESKHKIKKKAEQTACKIAYNILTKVL